MDKKVYNKIKLQYIKAVSYTNQTLPTRALTYMLVFNDT